MCCKLDGRDWNVRLCVANLPPVFVTGRLVRVKSPPATLFFPILPCFFLLSLPSCQQIIQCHHASLISCHSRTGGRSHVHSIRPSELSLVKSCFVARFVFPRDFFFPIVTVRWLCDFFSIISDRIERESFDLLLGFTREERKKERTVGFTIEFSRTGSH